MTQAQGEMTDLIAHIPHPPEILSHANEQHVQLLAALRRGDATRATALMADHLHGTEHVLAGLLPGRLRLTSVRLAGVDSRPEERRPDH